MDIEKRGTRIRFLGTPVSRGWESKEERIAATEGELPERKEIWYSVWVTS